ncbi:MAG TPA: peptidoglycan-binding protein [Blastocatellia bacterium]|nr:peptidoglycan-binding protein [Blastocatellia bacterium]
MKAKHNIVSLLSLAVAAAVLTTLAGTGYSQNSRPRYSSPQYSNQQYGSRDWTVPQDTVISMRMDRDLSSRTSRVGDRFTATVTIPVYVNGRTVIPAGSKVEGRVTQVTPAKRMSKSGTIAVDFDELVFPNGSRVPLAGNLTSDDPEVRDQIDDESRVEGRNNKRPAIFVGGGGAVGAVLGGMAGGGKGAVLGGVIGAGAGVAGVLLSKGEEAQVPAGTPFGINLQQPLVVKESYVDEGRGSYTGDADPPASRDNRYDRPRDYDRSTSDRPRDAGSDRYRDRQPDPDPDEPIDGDTDDMEPEPDPPPAARPSAGRPVETSAPAVNLPLSSPEMVRRAQIALKEQGYYEGQSDGVMSPRTSSALKTYQREHNLAETGDLDPQTARSLGILGGSASAQPSNQPPAQTVSRPQQNTGRQPAGETVLAKVLSATANRTAEGSIFVLIHTQGNTGGYRWFGEQLVNGDTLEVYARAVKPTGIVTQALTRGRIEMNVRDNVQHVRRVVVHGIDGDINLALAGGGSGGNVANVEPARDYNPAGFNIQRQAEELLGEYQRQIGVRLTGTGVELSNGGRYREAEIELLFALDGFANAAQLYARLASSLQDRDGLRGAVLSLARQARRTDRIMTTSSSRAADALATRWDAIRVEVLRLSQTHNINTADIDY